MLTMTLALTLWLAQAGAPGMPPRPPSSPDPNLTGSASIKGRITAADSGRPLRRARITVSGAPLTTPRSTSTNARGEYELRELPPGRYQVAVQRSGYLPMQLGQRRGTEPPRPIEVADGQAIEKLDFALLRTGIISGRVFDETNEPVAGVTMFIARQEFFRGRRRTVPVGSSATTDDLGNYRILNVPPGEYLVLATLRETWLAGPERHSYGYAPTFFPGSARAAEAQRVKVGRSQEVPNTDLALVPLRTAAVSGIATAADGTPMAGAQVSLSWEFVGTGFGMSMSVSGAKVAADGSWRIPDVAAGEYQLSVSVSHPDRLPARASTTVVVQGADVEGISLVAEAPGTITGQVITDTGEPLPAARSRIRVSTESTGADQRNWAPLGDESGVVNSDGRFTFAGVIGASAVRVTGLPRGWALKAVEGGDSDFAEMPLAVGGGQELDLRIVITNRFPTVSGQVVDRRGHPAEGTVLFFPADTAKWFDPSVLKMVGPDQTGVFKLETVRPGDYLAVALASVDAWQINDPEFLEEMRNTASRVTVREGQAEMLRLTVR